MAVWTSDSWTVPSPGRGGSPLRFVASSGNGKSPKHNLGLRLGPYSTRYERASGMLRRMERRVAVWASDSCTVSSPGRGGSPLRFVASSGNGKSPKHGLVRVSQTPRILVGAGTGCGLSKGLEIHVLD